MPETSLVFHADFVIFPSTLDIFLYNYTVATFIWALTCLPAINSSALIFPKRKVGLVWLAQLWFVTYIYFPQLPNGLSGWTCGPTLCASLAFILTAATAIASYQYSLVSKAGNYKVGNSEMKAGWKWGEGAIKLSSFLLLYQEPFILLTLC